MLVVYPIWERDPTNLSVFHFPSEVMDTRKLLTELFSKNGSSDGGERSASALRRVKTYLRTTMHQDRFNDKSLADYKDAVDKLPLDKCVNEFISLRSSNIAKFD